MRTTQRKKAPADILGGIGLGTLTFSGSLKATPAFAWFPLDLTLTSALVVLLSSVFIAMSEFRYRKISHSVLLPLALWTLFLIPVLGAPANPYAIQKITLLFTVTLLCAIAPFAIFRSRVGQKAFLGTLGAIGVFVAAGLAIEPSSVAFEYSNRLALEGATTITTAQMVGAGAMVVFLGVFTKTPWIIRSISFLVASSMLLICFLIGSRGPVIATFLAILILILGAKILRGRLVLGLTLVICMFIVSTYIAVRSDSGGMERILDFLTGDDTHGGSGRNFLYRLAFEVGIDNPLGIGWGSFSKYGAQYPHNLFLEFFVEGGLLIVFVVMTLFVIVGIIYSKKSLSLINSAFFGLYVFAVTASMFSSDISGNKLVWIMTFAAFVISGQDCKPEHTSKFKRLTSNIGPVRITSNDRPFR